MSFVYSRSEVMFESKRKVIGCIKGVQVRIGLHVLHIDGCADCNEVTASVMMARRLVHFAMQTAGIIIFRPTAQSATNLGCFHVHVDKLSGIMFERQRLS